MFNPFNNSFLSLLASQFVPYVKAALWQFVDKYGVSWADIIAVSGAAAAQFLGAKTKFPLVVGRCDANFENPEKVFETHY
jgi:catalase (peroxidase I)